MEPSKEAQVASEENERPNASVRVTTSSYAVECCEATAGWSSVAVGKNDDLPTLSFEWGGEKVTMLLDSGSAASLIDRENSERMIERGAAVKIRGQSSVSIRYADARVEPSCGEILANVCIDGKPAYLPFLIVEKLAQPLIGRRGLRLLGATLDFPQDTKEERIALQKMFESRSTDAMAADIDLSTAIIDCYSTNEEMFVADDRDLQAVESGLRRPASKSPAASEEGDVLDRRVDEVLARASAELHKNGKDYKGREKELLRTLFARVSELCGITISDGYELSLKREREASGKPEFSFVVKWTTKTSSSDGSSKVPRGWCSNSMIQRLDEDERSEFNQHCSVYTERGWWEKVEEDESELRRIRRSHLTGTIFPVKQKLTKSTRIRPVADMRGANFYSPAVSAVQPTVLKAGQVLRGVLRRGVQIRQYDLEKAFYSIGIEVIDMVTGEHTPVYLSVGKELFECSKLAFGLAVGPHALNCTQRIIRKVVRCAYDVLRGAQCQDVYPTIVVVMDDFVVAGEAPVLDVVEQLLLLGWDLCGFNCPDAKRERWSSGQGTRWLGNLWCWDDEHEKLSVKRCEAPVVPEAEMLSKRIVFQLAGKIGSVTGGAYEALARCHADAARVAAGRAGSWDDQDQPWAKEAANHLSLAREYWCQASIHEDGEVPIFSHCSHLTIDVDASGLGYGYCWRDEVGRVMGAEGRIQSRSMAFAAWHINRRELFAIAAALRKTVELVEADGFPALEQITVRSDSRVAVRQSSPWFIPATKSVERRAILRLRSVVADVSHALCCRNPPIDLRMVHISGPSNGIADALSRVGSSKKVVDLSVHGSEVSRSASPDIDCAVTNMVSWLDDDNYGAMSLPSFNRWVQSHDSTHDGPDDGGSSHPDQTTHLFRQFLKLHQEDDPFCQRVRQSAENDKSPIPGLQYGFILDDGLVVRLRPEHDTEIDLRDGLRLQVVIPESLALEYATAVHVEGGHCGVRATLSAMYQSAWGPKFRRHAKRAVKGCLACATTRFDTTTAQFQSGAVKMPQRVFEVLGCDVYGPFQDPSIRISRKNADGSVSSRQSWWIFTICCRLSGYTRFYLLNSSKANYLVDCLESFCWLVGVWPREIWTDRGSQFLHSSSWVSFVVSIGCLQKYNLAFTPSLGGWWERKHRELGSTLRALLQQRPTPCRSEADWRKLIMIAENRVNSTHSHEVIFGYSPIVPVCGAVLHAVTVPRGFRGDPDAVQKEAELRVRKRNDLLQIYEEEWLQCRNRVAMSKKLSSSTERLSPGDKTILFNPGKVGGSRESKLSGCASGPYYVLEAVGDPCYRLSLTSTGQGRSAVFHASRLRKYDGPANPESNVCPLCQDLRDDMVMVACDGCNQWFHISCLGLSEDSDAILADEWFCQDCLAKRGRIM
ncbi:gag/pol/env polyprotein, putative [Perkinsus marinus ATCC 50983]|uniref:Gag/pol/env polyprotein, putative n=1 Tax=Perkinsus marinus (strain ATCC 50983 / TXsc) TaxID=423536 RepID=C5LFQ4_PERM5|nr:gag/pol/env polyprotein, putative [Perkinsus marinus ATCC 50983]EER04439.1 gag/pol/env polyprotein, putative [Perkinsus marinus ATCC 50983]|eukprot:XP_002772623.1 gag/pol/env polyprotein, putative [Perkinsus marinus ATCC 50983]